MPYRLRLTVTVKVAVLVLALVSVAEQVTRVRRMRNREPDRGQQVTGTLESTSSSAVTLYLMRTRFARRGTRTVRFFAPLMVGGVRSNAYPGTISVPFQMSAPLKLLPGG